MQKSSDPQFEQSPISRRTFVRLSAATAGALTLPGNALADITSSKFTDVYSYVVNHVDEDFEIPTLLTLDDESGFDALTDLGLNPVTTTKPQPAAYVVLTRDQTAEVADNEQVSQLQFSPGSNPFWLLNHYPNGVFPDTHDAVSYIDYEQMIDGMNHLESRHEDRLRFYGVGESPGHYNAFLGEDDPKEVYVAEVTNDITDEEAFREKEKALFVLSIHGDERSGAEAGTRFIEQVLDGGEPEIEALLDDVVLVFLYANPDGWVSRNPQYDLIDDLGHNSFKRETATGVDPNRQYPTVGWINPGYHPAEPNGQNLVDDEPGIDADVPSEYTETVPDSLAIVDHLRDYKNLRVGSDLHGKFMSTDFINGLIVNDQYSHDQFHDLYEWNQRTQTRVDAALGDLLKEHQDDFAALNQRYGFSDAPVPDVAYSYGTILDTIGYTTTGTLISWMSHPEEQGGLGMQIMAHEMGWDNRVLHRRPYEPWLTNLWVVGYQEVIRATTRHAVRSVQGTIEADAKAAYVTTDALTRSSSDLSTASSDRRQVTKSVTAGPQWESTAFDVSDGTQSLSVTVSPEGDALAQLRNPSGQVVRTFNSTSAGIHDQAKRTAEWTVLDPAAGEWSVTVKTQGGGTTTATVTVTTLLTEGDEAVPTPDPVDALGYQQRAYEVSPLTYFEDYRDYLTRSGTLKTANHDQGRSSENRNDDATLMQGVSVTDIANGALRKGAKNLRVENLVISHAEGIDNQAYIDELDRFVEAGGNLIVTDRGVALLGVMENALAARISSDDITEVTLFSAFLGERNEDHPLLADTRPIQRELWKPAPLGYPITFTGEAPMTVVDVDAFEQANGTIAGITYEQPFAERSPYVGAGSLSDANGGGIHVIGGLLPPGNQSNLHPFGLLEYTPTFLGHTMLTNALGFVQNRYVDGELDSTFGE
ncbi:M14 family metallopeptidase [Halorussus salinisoli]|uniref:M14 family metallopeptidase n=1 Tax=Halorussus salinisoli TaxID=2558242 RepID=UPI0010C1F827|nr:M14 family metallopeptidase [Halorussus salinisoli]